MDTTSALLVFLSFTLLVSGHFVPQTRTYDSPTNSYYNMLQQQPQQQATGGIEEEEEEEQQQTTPNPVPVVQQQSHIYPVDIPIPRIPYYPIPKPRFTRPATQTYYPKRPVPLTTQPRRLILWRPLVSPNPYTASSSDFSCRLAAGQCTSVYQSCYGISLSSFCPGRYSRCCIPVRGTTRPVK